MRKFLVFFLLACPVFATINGPLIEQIGDALYFEFDDQTYDCESFEDIKKTAEEAGHTFEDPTTITQSLCQLLGTRTEAREALDQLADAIGGHEIYVLNEASTEDTSEDQSVYLIPNRAGFLTEQEMALLISKENKTGDEEKKTFFYQLLNPLYTGEEVADTIESEYVVNTANPSDGVEKNVKRNNELLFALDVQAKALAELSFRKSLLYDAASPEGVRALCKDKKTLQEKLRCDFIYQMMMAKTLWEMAQLSNFASGVTSKRLIEGIPKKDVFRGWETK